MCYRLWKGENRDIEFVDIVNPHHEVPAMRHEINGDTFYLSETHAIMQYLCELCGPETTQQYFGRDIVERSVITHLLSWLHLGLRKRVMLEHLLPAFIRPYYLGTAVLKRPDENSISKWRSGCMEPLLHLNNKLTGGKRFLVGGRLTAADIALAPAIAQILVDPEYRSILGNFPNVARWLFYMSQRDAWKIAHYAVADAAEVIREHYKSKRSLPGSFDWVDKWETRFAVQIVREPRLPAHCANEIMTFLERSHSPS